MPSTIPTYRSTRLFCLPPQVSFTLLFNGSTSFCLTLLPSTIALLDSTWLYINLSWLNFTPLHSIAFCHGCTLLYLTLHYSTMTLLHSALTLLPSTMDLFHFLTLHYSTMALLHSNLTLHYFSMASFYLTQHYSTMTLHQST